MRLLKLIILAIFTVYGANSTAQSYDPFQQPGTGNDGSNNNFLQAKPEIKLYATLISPKGNIAFMNGKIVKIGEELDGYKVINIEPRKIVVEYKRKQYSFSLLSTVSN